LFLPSSSSYLMLPLLLFSPQISLSSSSFFPYLIVLLIFSSNKFPLSFFLLHTLTSFFLYFSFSPPICFPSFFSYLTVHFHLLSTSKSSSSFLFIFSYNFFPLLHLLLDLSFFFSPLHRLFFHCVPLFLFFFFLHYFFYLPSVIFLLLFNFLTCTIGCSGSERDIQIVRLFGLISNKYYTAVQCRILTAS
jgi:hypothetical protein